MFTLFDEDKSGTLEELEVKKFINLLLKTNSNYKQGDGTSFIDRIYSILDEQKTGNVTVEDFIRVAKSNPQLSDLINSYTSLIVYDVDFEQKKSKKLDTKEFEDQVAGHSGGKKRFVFSFIFNILVSSRKRNKFGSHYNKQNMNFMKI